MNIPQKFVDNVKKDINYQIKISPAVIKVPYVESPILKAETEGADDDFKLEKDVMGNLIPYVMYQKKWYEIVAEVHKDFQGKKSDFYLIRVNKKEHSKAYPYNSFGYFILPPELEAIYGKRCKTLTDICFMSNDIEKLFSRAGHVKFDMGALACAGDGNKASRYNPIREIREQVPCVCAYSRYYTDYTEQELATEFTITPDMKKEEVYREYKKYGSEELHKEVLVQGAWRGILSRSGEHIKLKPFTDNKPPCDFGFELLFCAPHTGLHLNKLHSTGLENYLRIKGSIESYQQVLSEFGINIRTQPMNLVLRIMETKNKKLGKLLYPQVSVEFPQSILELIKQSSKNTYLQDGYDEPKQLQSGTGFVPPANPPATSETVDTNTGEYEDAEDVTAEEVNEEQTALQKQVADLTAEINKEHSDPDFVTCLFKDKQITVADTEDSLQEQLTILQEFKLKEF